MRKAINIIKKQKRNMSKRLKIGKELTELNIYIYMCVCVMDLSCEDKKFVHKISTYLWNISLEYIASSLRNLDFILEDRLNNMRDKFDTEVAYSGMWGLTEAELVFTRKKKNN